MATRPNILIITTDQQRWDALSLWGSAGYRTPVLDELGRSGVIFDRSYCPSPVCTPARVSMITGQYSTMHGAYTIGMEPVPALEGPTLGTLFSDAGYATGLIGKTHFVARRIEDQHVAGVALDAECPDGAFWAGFDGPYCGFQHLRHHRHHNAAGTPNAHYRVWLEAQGADMARIDRLHGDGDLRPDYGSWDMDPELSQNAFTTDECLRFVDEVAGERPWLAMANYQDPHYPYICPKAYYDAVDMDGVDLGGPVPGEMAGKPPFYDYFMQHQDWRDDPETAFWDGICVPNISRYDRKKPYEAIRAYIGMCNMVDDHVGRLIQGLKDRGRYDNTLIIFTSDHGDQLGQHGTWGKGPMAYDDNQRVPGLMCWPAAQQGPVGHVPGHFSHVDILPTCCDAAGITLPPFVQGISQLPVLRGETTAVRDWAMVDHIISKNQTHPEHATVDVHQTSFVFEGWKLVVYSHADYGELYDLEQDPQQLHNRFDSEPERRARMLQRLARAHMERCATLPIRIGPC